jgi:hypothetical protein
VVYGKELGVDGGSRKPPKYKLDALDEQPKIATVELKKLLITDW